MKLRNVIEPFAVGFLNADKYDDAGYRIACGMLHQAKYMPITIDADEFFVGEYDYEDCAVKCHYGNTVQVNEELMEQKIAAYPHLKEELEYIYEKMLPWDSHKVFLNSCTDVESKLMEMKACWGGEWGGHANPDYETFLKLGTNGIRQKIEEAKAANPGREAFYEGLKISMDALDVWSDRYSLLAYKQSLYAQGEKKEHLLRLAGSLSYCPKNPPRDFFDACQMFWLCFVFIGTDSPGRFDQFMIDYYRKSDPADALICLEALWQLFFKTRTWNLCVSGSDEKGNDMSNELSYLVLQTARKYKYATPNITMRVHAGTPEDLLEEAVMTYASGVGMPSLYNDETVCPALMSLGIPDHDAHDYCMNGCNQIDIMGKSHMGLEDGEVCMAKCLELTLFNGECQYSHEKIGLVSGQAEAFDTYETLLAAFKKQVEYVTDHAVNMANKAQKIYAQINPNPFRSCLIQGCIEKGRDYKNGGPLYNHGQILAEGIADTADSLAAIKYYVYETKKYTMEQLGDALQKDFEGYEELYQDVSSFKKFGNDDDYVDRIAVEIVEHFFTYLRTKRTFRGGTYTGGCSPFNRVASYGEKIQALPNGKQTDDTTLADSIGSVPGEDAAGVTALLNSALKYPHHLAGSGFILNLKFNKSLFDQERGHLAAKALIRAYFADGGQNLSPMVVSREELEDALIHPEKHKNLIVRVGGYSDYFINLSPELQQNVIRRTYLEV